ncbi:hypothetical protein MM239_01890 [Belliella sp. DSM 111904]|uniref:Signal transduction histidine kinase dimerisation/phosphoacceptor domain-containing protein n=1 Tax=Belliella filtrata TaxID=2923435 RepID=A0ABS9UVD9_9BACT|nr:hypothetical protein [Belliella filtrata]MCH7408132.1 hypothetical protein [Belliella filtrata]
MYGSLSDVSHHFQYEAALEQISFDISHVLRRPVTTMLSIVNLLESEDSLTHEKILEYSGFFKTITNELENFTRDLNQIYAIKKITTN